MASAQVMGVNDEQQKEIVQQMVEKAKSFAKNNNVVQQSSSQGSAVVSFANETTAMINFNKSYDWSGNISGVPYPPTILSKNSGNFVHVGQSPDGSSGAVVYYGNNAVGTSCAWLLAWSAPTNPSASNGNKVYVACGSSSNFGSNINWADIKNKLNNSSDYQNAWDPVTKTTIAANIVPGGSFASLGATFGLLN